MKKFAIMIVQLATLALPLIGFVVIGCAHVRPIAAVSIEAIALAGDLHSTDKAIERGAAEANPLLRHHRKAIMISISVPAFVGTYRTCKQSRGWCIFSTGLYSAPHAFAWWHNDQVTKAGAK